GVGAARRDGPDEHHHVCGRRQAVHRRRQRRRGRRAAGTRPRGRRQLAGAQRQLDQRLRAAGPGKTEDAHIAAVVPHRNVMKAMNSSKPYTLLVAIFAAVLAPAAGAQPEAPERWDRLTPWGDPDLQGRWPVHHMTLTPFERPVELGTRAVLTGEEFAERVAAVAARNEAYERETSSNQMGMRHWAEAGRGPQRQASLIVDPPNGGPPALPEAGRAKSKTMRSSWQDIPFDGPSDFDTWDRCITRGLPASMFPMQYNNGIEIMQTPGYVIIRLEMIHETRIVPVDGRPPLDGAIKQWMGESRGRWEGSTLVVETTNFNGRATLANVG